MKKKQLHRNKRMHVVWEAQGDGFSQQARHQKNHVLCHQMTCAQPRWGRFLRDVRWGLRVNNKWSDYWKPKPRRRCGKKWATGSCCGAEPTETRPSSEVQFESNYGSRGLLEDPFQPSPFDSTTVKNYSKINRNILTLCLLNRPKP